MAARGSALATVASVVTLVTFVVTYASTGTLKPALGIMGYIYILAVPFVLCLRGIYIEWIERAKGGGDEHFGRSMLVGGVIVVVGSAIFLPHLDHHELHKMGFLQYAGLALVEGIILATFFWIYADHLERRGCPECMNQVHAKARLCQYCGYRWKPSLAVDPWLAGNDGETRRSQSGAMRFPPS